MAGVAEQVGQRCAAGQKTAHLTLDRLSLDQLGCPVLADVRKNWASGPDELSYLPPEQMDSAEIHVDATAHVYSIGVVFYSLLCGRAPFTATHHGELKRQIKEDLPQPPRQLVHGVPVEVESICLKALEKDRSRRYATPQVMAAELQKLIVTAEDSISSGSISFVASPPNQAVVENRLAAVVLCKPSFNGNDTSNESLLTFIQSTIADCLGTSRVRSLGDRILIDSRSTDGTSVALLLSDVSDCLSAIRAHLSTQNICESVEIRVRFFVSAAAFVNIEIENVRFTATQLHARIDGESIRLTADSRSTLRRWSGSTASDQSEPVELAAILESSSDDLNVAETPFVGREAQLGMLMSRWTQCLEGMGQVVLVIGGEGSGKSRLVAEFVERITRIDSRMTWIAACCRPLIRGVGYACLSETYCQFGQKADSEVVVSSETETVANGSESENSATNPVLAQLSSRLRQHKASLTSGEKFHFAQAFLQWLESMAESSPVLFTVEDVQWADPATLDFMQHIVTEGPTDRILTLLTCKGDFETPWGSHPNQSQIALPSLSRRHVAEILRLETDGEFPSDEFVQKVKRITKGIPSLIEGVRDGVIPV